MSKRVWDDRSSVRRLLDRWQCREPRFEPNARRLVLCVGMKRSGSTWLFNVVRYCLMNAGMCTYSDYEDGYDCRVASDAHVLKVHPYRRLYHEKADCILATIRDVRDAVASMVRMGLIPETSEAVQRCARELLFDEYGPWSAHADLEIRYENMIADRSAAIGLVIKALGLSGVDASEVQRDVEKLKFVVSPGRDRATQLWPGHITDGRTGSYRDTLSPESIRVIESVAGPWLAEHGYAV